MLVVQKTNITYNADGSVTTTGALGHSRTLTFSAHNGVYQPDQVIDSAATASMLDQHLTPSASRIPDP